MATLTRGYTFGATEQVTNAKLHALVDSGTVTSIEQSDLSAGLGIIARQATAPSDTDQVWIDTSQTPPILKHYDGAAWVPSDEYKLLTNNTAQSMSAGHVTIIDVTGSEKVKFTSTAGDTAWRGIATSTVAASAAGVFKSHGYVPNVTLEISASAGCFLKSSTATGKAEPTTVTQGVFGYVTTQGTASAGAYLFGSPIGGHVPSATNALTGSIIQVVNGYISGTASGTGTFGALTTIPTMSSGNAGPSASITPSSASNKFLIEAVMHLGCNAQFGVVSLFSDRGSATANAIQVSEAFVSQANDLETISLKHIMNVGTATATTFYLRYGAVSDSSYLNRTYTAGTNWGGAMLSEIIVQEIKG